MNVLPIDTRMALNRLGREQMKTKLLADIRFDMEACKIEGWDETEYLRDLHAMIAALIYPKP